MIFRQKVLHIWWVGAPNLSMEMLSTTLTSNNRLYLQVERLVFARLVITGSNIRSHCSLMKEHSPSKKSPPPLPTFTPISCTRSKFTKLTAHPGVSFTWLMKCILVESEKHSLDCYAYLKYKSCAILEHANVVTLHYLHYAR